MDHFHFQHRLLALFIAILLGSAVGNRHAARHGVSIESALWLTIGGAIVAARVAFALAYWSHYAAEPWRLIDIRDGGVKPLVGQAAALIIGGALALCNAVKRRAIAAGVGSGAMVRVLATSLASLAAPSQRLPALTLVALDAGRCRWRRLQASRRWSTCGQAGVRHVGARCQP